MSLKEIDLQNWETQLRKGLLEIVILNILKSGRSHGYEIVQKLKQIDGLGLREGNIYPILARLQADNLVANSIEPSQDGPPRKYFALTMQGKKVLVEMNAHWERMVSSVALIRKENRND